MLLGKVGINQIVYTELSVSFGKLAELDAVLSRLNIEKIDLPWEVAHLTAQAFVAYRRKGGEKSSPLPDFYIYAHAQFMGLSLLTRDARRCRTYFSDVNLITPL